MTKKKLPKKTLFFYGLSEMPLSIASLPLLAFIPNYYVSDLGLDFAVVALVKSIGVPNRARARGSPLQVLL